MLTQIEKWGLFEAVFNGPKEGNPFLDVTFSAVFQNENNSIDVNGFYDGEGNYVVRFMPEEIGEWRFKTKSNINELNNLGGEFICIAESENNHGPVKVRSQLQAPKSIQNLLETEDKFHFSYSDGNMYYPFGTTCYAWINQPLELQEKTLETLRNSAFNKIRMCIFPKHYTYNFDEPIMYPYEGNIEDGFDLERFNPKFFELLEKRILELQEMGIEADIILLHPYDRWGFAKMTAKQDDMYIKYVVSRLASFRNVWWSLANEFDLMTEKSIEDWERMARIIQRNDPYQHLKSIHNCIKMYDHTRPWITHCSIQRIDVYKSSECTNEWRELYAKPIVIDECGYEGNINFGWGNITGQDMIRRFWEGTVRGGYVGHGETYVHPEDILWWSHGGELHGSSPERIKFLRKIVEEAPGILKPLKLTTENHEANWDVPCATIDEDYLLYYFGFFQPSFRTYELAEGREYKIDIIDTWDMTITSLEGVYSGSIRIDLPGKQYIAVRMTALN